MRESTQLYRRLLTYAFQYKHLFFVSFFGFILYAAGETALVKMVEYFIEGLESRNQEFLVFIPAFLVVVSIVRGAGHFIGAYFISKVGLGVVNDLRKALFGSLVYLPNRFYDERNSGELVSMLIYNIQQVTGSVTEAIKTAMREGLVAIGLLSYMFYTSWQLTLSFILIAPILAGLVAVASRYFRKLSRRMQTSMGGITHIANEALQGFRLVRSYIGQKYEIKRFNQASDLNTKLNDKYQKVSALQAPVFHFVLAIDLAIILFLVLLLWKDNVGTAVAYLAAATAIAKPIRQLSTINETIQKGLAAAETIFATLDEPKEIDLGESELKVNRGQIEFKNLGFEYNPGEPALKNINLNIEAGTTVALVGHSGSGKSTITNLLMGFYHPTQGSISIDGQDIHHCRLNSLRQHIALVNQQSVLFNDSIANNIAYGVDDEIKNIEAIEAAAQHANAMEFITKLPQGLNTLVGEDGARLSGGQRQRISIARALYKDAPILVLDEATSALDNESEKNIQNALDTLQKNRTTLVVAHRLSTIENADKIVVLSDGEIVEQGTHNELLQKQGYYWSLYNSQSTEAE